MPARAARLCACGAKVQDGGACPSCASRRKRESDARRPPARRRGYDTRWDKARRTYLGKNPYCVMCAEKGEQVLASVVDHIRPHHGDQALFWDKSNWAGLCTEHHSGAKQSMEATGRSAASFDGSTTVHLVCGPPGSGRGEYVSRLIKPGDLVVNLDSIFAAISGLPLYDQPRGLLPFACEARDALIRRLQHSSAVPNAWIIAGAAKAAERDRLCRGNAVKATVLMTPPSACMRRILADPKRKAHAAEWRKLVDRWWSDWQRRDGETVITPASNIRRRGESELRPSRAGPARVPTRETISD